LSHSGDSTEKLIIIAETVMPENPELAQAINEQVRSAFGLTVNKVVLVGRGSIPKTSSGKLQRRRTKAMFEDGLLGNSGERSNTPSQETLALG
jgi:fatty-acyl-CoA synthase